MYHAFLALFIVLLHNRNWPLHLSGDFAPIRTPSLLNNSFYKTSIVPRQYLVPIMSGIDLLSRKKVSLPYKGEWRARMASIDTIISFEWILQRFLYWWVKRVVYALSKYRKVSMTQGKSLLLSFGDEIEHRLLRVFSKNLAILKL